MVIDAKKSLILFGEMSVTGRLIDASNATLYATVCDESRTMTCIYKPVAGERPLWDFPDGGLANREYAAYLVSEAMGFDVVPLTVLREGPYGSGMVQEWIDIDESIDLAEFFSTDLPSLRAMAIFDAVINNTDRKIGHLLPSQNGKLFGCDHGVTFHSDDKLRTVLWQWAGEKLTGTEIDQLHNGLDLVNGQLDLSPYLSPPEIKALTLRLKRLLASGVMPVPSADWPPVPWPAF